MKQIKKVTISFSIFLIFVLGFISGCTNENINFLKDFNIKDFKDSGSIINNGNLASFSSCSVLKSELEKAYKENYRGNAVAESAGVAKSAASDSAVTAPDYSQTNVQVKGVDEADIVKTDGKYIYMVSYNKLVIAKAYPSNEAKILSETELKGFNPQELFIDDDKVLIFGSSSYEYPVVEAKSKAEIARPGIGYYPYYLPLMSLKLIDVKDKENPEIVREVDFEGNYLTSRKIGSFVYFVINNYPRYYIMEKNVDVEEIIPRVRDDKANNEFVPSVGCSSVRYFEPIVANNFITVAAFDMDDEDSEINKEVILGSGQNVYASQENLYVAEVDYGYAYRGFPEVDSEFPKEKTNVHKFSLNDGEINYLDNGVALGRILNQFSMDEYKGNFRIATTIGNVWDENKKSSNNVYVFDEEMNLIGELEGLAPGEKIYSTRFMGDRGYMVTFKKVDPLFVIDLKDPENPEVLGKLKIPGFSDYLHPYDEDHIIGVGKDTVEAEENLKENRGIDFAWYQGLKLAIFDVSDVENPKQMHVELIGDRGTHSDVLSDHKAFLFDRERNLLVLPVNLAILDKSKYSGKLQGFEYGDFVFQGAYVYDINLEDGFKLKGRITHYDDEDVFKKSGYYFYGNDYNVKRSLYIDNILYTISDGKIKLNDLSDLEEIKELKIKIPERDYPVYY